jgi:protein-S-isoprenylcysteine O-methyltransferase Ste14
MLKNKNARDKSLNIADNAGVRFPPPLVYTLGLLLGAGLRKIAPVLIVPHAWHALIAWVLLAGSLALLIPGFATFARTKTPLAPNKPVNQLFASGVYLITRNPLYVALALLYLSISFAANSLWMLVLLVPVMIYIDIGVVRKEEQYLGRRFGAQYTTYKQRVRRWL